MNYLGSFFILVIFLRKLATNLSVAQEQCYERKDNFIIYRQTGQMARTSLYAENTFDKVDVFQHVNSCSVHIKKIY